MGGACAEAGAVFFVYSSTVVMSVLEVTDRLSAGQGQADTHTHTQTCQSWGLKEIAMLLPAQLFTMKRPQPFHSTPQMCHCQFLIKCFTISPLTTGAFSWLLTHASLCQTQRIITASKNQWQKCMFSVSDEATSSQPRSSEAGSAERVW